MWLQGKELRVQNNESACLLDPATQSPSLCPEECDLCVWAVWLDCDDAVVECGG